MSSLPFTFVDEGGKGLQPVVFLHAFPYYSAMWEPQRAALKDRARFIALDARGLGPQGKAPTAYMLEHLVDDVLALLDHLRIESAVLCGLSMGGYVALRAVQRAPERVRGLLLANTQAASDSDEGKVARAQGVTALAQKGVEAFGAAQLQRQLSPHTQQNKPELVAKLSAWIAQSSPEAIAASLVAIATRTDSRSALASIRVPTRVVVGEGDTITPLAAAKTLTDAIPGSGEPHVLAHAGHLSNLEAEAEFNALLLDFLGSLR